MEDRYYTLEPSLPLVEVLRRWGEERRQPHPRSMPQFYSPAELEAYRGYAWTREAAGGAVWDTCAASLKGGWDPARPLRLEVAPNGVALISDGTHRLAVSRALGLERIPVTFRFHVGPIRRDP